VSSPLEPLHGNVSDVHLNASEPVFATPSNTQMVFSRMKFMKCGGLFAKIASMRHYEQMVHTYNAHMVMVTYPVNTYLKAELLPHVQKSGKSVFITACLQCQQYLNPVPPNGLCPFRCPPCVRHTYRCRCQRRRCYFQTQLFLIKEAHRKQVAKNRLQTHDTPNNTLSSSSTSTTSTQHTALPPLLSEYSESMDEAANSESLHDISSSTPLPSSSSVLLPSVRRAAAYRIVDLDEDDDE
jgi:hypothetical protein